MDSILSSYGSPFLAAIAIGLSCGTGCSPLISLFLASFIMGNSGSVKKGLLSFFYFFMGKTSVVVILAFLSALFGNAVFNADSSFFGFNFKVVLDIFLIITGVVLLLKIFFHRAGSGSQIGHCSQTKKSIKVHSEELGDKDQTEGLQVGQCSEARVSASCNLCTRKGKTIKDNTGFAVFFAGAAYGITPCAPLLMILVLASLSGPAASIPISFVFSISTALSPLIVLSAIAGLFSKKMHDEIPQFIKLFRIIAYISFIILGSISMIFHLK